jgi:AcrR family transcriptional regulator
MTIDCLLKTKARWARRKEARPQELLAAALDLFVERGYAATRLEDVAAHAGVSKGTLYLYFCNKEELFKAVVRDTVLPLIGEAELAIDQHDGSSAELLRELLLGWWRRIGDTKLSGISKLMMAESGNFPEVAKFYHDEVISRGHAMIGRVLERGIALGEFRAVDARQAANVIMAPVVMLMMWKHSFSDCRPEPISAPEYLTTYIDLLFRGLLSDPSQQMETP